MIFLEKRVSKEYKPHIWIEYPAGCLPDDVASWYHDDKFSHFTVFQDKKHFYVCRELIMDNLGHFKFQVYTGGWFNLPFRLFKEWYQYDETPSCPNFFEVGGYRICKDPISIHRSFVINGNVYKLHQQNYEPYYALLSFNLYLEVH